MHTGQIPDDSDIGVPGIKVFEDDPFADRLAKVKEKPRPQTKSATQPEETKVADENGGNDILSHDINQQIEQEIFDATHYHFLDGRHKRYSRLRELRILAMMVLDEKNTLRLREKEAREGKKWCSKKGGYIDVDNSDMRSIRRAIIVARRKLRMLRQRLRELG